MLSMKGYRIRSWEISFS